MAEPHGRLMVIFSLGGLALQRRLRGGAVRCRTGFVALGGPPQVVLDPFPARGGQGVVENGRATLVRDGVEVASRPLGSPGGVRRSGHAGRLRWDDLDLLAYVGTTLWTWLALPLVVADPAAALAVRDLGGPGEGGLRRVEVTVPAGWPATAFGPRRPATAFRPRRPATAFRPRRPATAFGPRRPATAFGPRRPATAFGSRHVLHLDSGGRVQRHEEAGFVHHLSGHCDFGGVEVATSRRTRHASTGHLTVAWADVVAAHVLPAPQPGGKSLN